jgi:hypothetical protein
MPSCRFLKLQADGFHADCGHPEARGEPCILNTEDGCLIREPVITTMQLSKDTLDRLRRFGYPAEKALIALLEAAEARS